MDDCSSSEESDNEEEPEDGLGIPVLEDDQNEGELLGGWVWSVTSLMAELD